MMLYIVLSNTLQPQLSKPVCLYKSCMMPMHDVHATILYSLDN